MTKSCRKTFFRRMVMAGCYAGLLSVSIIACRSVPYSGRSQLLLTSESAETEMGQQAWREYLGKTRKSSNQKYRDALRRVGKNLAAVSGRPDFKWEFELVEEKDPNAFCLPGGKVAATAALFKYTANDAELAAVVGHEIGHAIARHGGERVSQDTIQSLGLAVVKSATNQSAWQAVYGATANVGVILPYSRKHEYEADYIGLMLMAQAGYDPAAALAFWNKFAKLSQSGSVSEFFSTHPMGSKRQSEMREEYGAAVKLYNKAPVKRGLGEKY